MNDKIKTVQSLNLTGLSCPMPILKVSKAAKEMNQGEVLEALTSDPGALTDFPAWARTSGNEIIKTETEGGNTRFFIKKN